MVEPKGKQSNSAASPLTKGVAVRSFQHIPRDFSLILRIPRGHDQLLVVEINLIDEIFQYLIARLRVVEVRVKELLEVRLDAVARPRTARP